MAASASVLSTFVFQCPPAGEPGEGGPVPRTGAMGTCLQEVFHWIGRPLEGRVGQLCSQRDADQRRLSEREPYVTKYLADPSINPPLFQMLAKYSRAKVRTDDLCNPPKQQIFQRVLNQWLPVDPHAYDPALAESVLLFRDDETCQENLAQFLAGFKLRRLFELNRAFLAAFEKTPEGEFSQIDLIGGSGDRITDFGALPLSSRVRLTDLFVRGILVELYGLSPSTWNPRTPGRDQFEDLIEAIDQRGPIAVLGRLGREYFTEAPKVLAMDKRLNRPVSYWKGGTYKEKRPGDPEHAVLIVGAEKVGSLSLIYFIDPNDNSDPSQEEIPQVYCMTYKSLCERVIPLKAGNDIGFHGMPGKRYVRG